MPVVIGSVTTKTELMSKKCLQNEEKKLQMAL